MAFRQRALIAALAAALALGVGGEAFARAGGGFSLGSRGARTFSMPSPTPTAPRVSPFDRSATQNGAISGGPARGGMFAGSFGRGLLGGFLGAGLFGLLFGHGLFGGLGGGLSFLGLILQLSLLYLLFKFVMGFVRGNGPAFQDAGLFGRSSLGFGQGGFGSRGFGGPGGQAGPFSQAKFEPSSQDFAAFEQRLAEVQYAFGAEDVERLRLLATPEMVSYFAGELADNAGRGLVNRISGIKLVQGDLSEAWREPNAEFATVAMRYSLSDTMVERSSGRIVAGDPQAAEEVTEVWTFRRPAGGVPGEWMLSAIQQT